MDIIESATGISVAPVVADTKTQDQELAVRANDILQAAPFPELRRIRCQCDRGVLVLTGQVDSFFMKQMAQESLRKMPGVDHLSNAIRVTDRTAQLPK